MGDEAAAAAQSFGALRAMLLAHVPPLELSRDDAGAVELLTPRSAANGAKLRFASLTLGDGEVRLQLMPIARDKSPSDPVSPALRARMRGAQLFAITAPDATLFEDSARLLAACVAICRLRNLA